MSQSIETGDHLGPRVGGHPAPDATDRDGPTPSSLGLVEVDRSLAVTELPGPCHVASLSRGGAIFGNETAPPLAHPKQALGHPGGAIGGAVQSRYRPSPSVA